MLQAQAAQILSGRPGSQPGPEQRALTWAQARCSRRAFSPAGQTPALAFAGPEEPALSSGDLRPQHRSHWCRKRRAPKTRPGKAAERKSTCNGALMSTQQRPTTCRWTGALGDSASQAAADVSHAAPTSGARRAPGQGREHLQCGVWAARPGPSARKGGSGSRRRAASHP